MGYSVALVGNPNCGKTTAFNALTGSKAYVGNWPGVTVEKKEGKLRGVKEDITLVDLPGIYSLSPYTPEEVVARNYIIKEQPDLIINIIDASNIERNLYLTHQLVELGRPTIIALNMMDIVEKRGEKINIKRLEELFGVKVVPISATKNQGLDELINLALEVGTKKVKIASKSITFDMIIEQSINEVMTLLDGKQIDEVYNKRWLAIKVLEQDKKVVEEFHLSKEESPIVEEAARLLETTYDDDVESIIINGRYEYITKHISSIVTNRPDHKITLSDKIDKVITNRILAIPIFFGIMWFVYFLSIQTVGDMTIGFMEGLFGTIGDQVGLWLEGMGVSPWIHGLVVDGIIGGVGAVLGFVPQLMILFLLIGILEDCGYMSRVAFIMDKIFRKFGLSGKSFIPMVIGTGCSVPGIMASRTIESERDRKMTIMLTPFIPCGAKLPVFALMVGAFFPEHVWVGPSMYVLGILMVILSGLILKNTLFKGEAAPYILELPEYHIPNFKGVMMQMWDRSKAFIIKAGTVIFVASGLIWFLQSFNFSLQMVDTNESMLASIGHVIAPIFAPLGFGTWQASVATVTGFLAKEAVVATFGILLGVGEVAETDPTLLTSIGQFFTPVSAYAFMAFTLLAAPCFAAIGAMKREFGNWKWTLIAIGYQTGLAWIVAFLIYQVGSLLFK
ncbi:MAG: ferrous iron transport protein B [Zhenhengia sp.]|jgi:ferrous iron transport protein B|uniref:ferrous iron transport protein B n=1 Tax=Zhenhengia sp. TaxID=2944208 RepID=UPI0029151B3D|nr:ferrous iron transport protein B [Clostridiales bacterium]MDU6974922.1 ferrous iron transport protein B [Clostridiales bacterium]